MESIISGRKKGAESPELQAGKDFLAALQEMGLVLSSPDGKVSPEQIGQTLFKILEEVGKDLGVKSIRANLKSVAKSINRSL